MNAVFGTPASSVVVDVVQRERLLDVVTHLVDGDVVALVVHPVLLDARAQVRLVGAALRAERVARAARRIDDDVVGEILRLLLGEAEPDEKIRDVLLVRLGASGSAS